MTMIFSGDSNQCFSSYLMLDYLESRPFHGIHWTTGINEKGRKILGAKTLGLGIVIL